MNFKYIIEFIKKYYYCKSMRYDLEKIPFEALSRPVAEATAALVRLDERLRQSPLGSGCLERLHFYDACASLWIDGELVHLEDLVLHDASRDIRSPTHELTIAHAVLRTRRRMLRHPIDWAFSQRGLAALRGAETDEEEETVGQWDSASSERPVFPIDSSDDQDILLSEELAEINRVLERSSAILTGEQPLKRRTKVQKAPLVYDPDWGEEERLAEWRDVWQRTADMPAVTRTALLLDAWTSLDVFERTPWLGRLLAARSLAQANLTTEGHLATVNLGLKLIKRNKRTNKNPETRLTALLSALIAAADFGLKEHDKLVLAHQRLVRRLKGRRRSSNLPALIDLVLSRPMVSAGMIAKEIEVTPQAALRLVGDLNLRELTGRGRFRAWGIL